MKRWIFAAVAGLVVLALPGVTVGHELDHPGPALSESADIPAGVNSGGPNADWELVTTVATGNPQTDLDFFTQNGETYASVGTLAAGANGAGQTIIRLTQDGKVNENTVELVAGHPSAECPSNPSAALGLQHDVEAAPKGNGILNTGNPFADRRDTQLLIDATDQAGRCHDNGDFGLVGAPRGGLEIIDITAGDKDGTSIQNPKEIGLTSHIGEAHTVNVDPKRPHIAFAVTSDAVTVRNNGTPEKPEYQRENEIEGDNDQNDLDGFEVVDMSSCMNFPKGTSLEDKRKECRPKVYRYRYPRLSMSLGHTNKGTVYGCHELEIYPNDRLTCGSGAAAMYFDLSGAFRDMGTPNDYSDDKPRGTPMPCRVRDSSSAPPYGTGAKVTDCVTGKNDVDLRIPNWLKLGKPGRLEGVEFLGSAFHQGRAGTPYDATEDVDFDHELELTNSRNFVIATDERGGGVTPPGATCDEANLNKQGNGGLHAYAVDRLDHSTPATAEQAWKAYAREPDGDKAIYRTQPRTGFEATTCTAHVFQQVPGQNRIFMGWYTQGTQVVDFIENKDGSFKFKYAGHFIPQNANEWTSHVFKVRENRNGTFTYWGAATDFALEKGRNAIDIYKVTLPRPISSPSPCSEKRAIRGDDGVNALVGTPRGDIICGLGGDDQIRGRGGDDFIVGGSGNDSIGGGGGKDQISGDAGNDTVSGGALHDSITGDDGKDTLKGNKGIDTAKGGVGSDVLQGGEGDDSLYGNDGDDRLRVYSGDDFLNGGRGHDTCTPGRGDDRTRSCE